MHKKKSSMLLAVSKQYFGEESFNIPILQKASENLDR